MASPSPQRQWGRNGAIRPELDDKLAVQRSLQEAVEDYLLKATVSDPPELIRQQALSSCNLPPFDWRDQKKPSDLQLWNAYWEKDAFRKREGQCFFYRSYTGKTRTLKLDLFATIAEVEVAIKKKEGDALLEGSLKSDGKVLAKKYLDLNDYHVKPGSTFDLPSRLCGGGDDDDARTDRGPSTTKTPTQLASVSVSTSMGVAGKSSLLPEGDSPESLRVHQNTSAHDIRHSEPDSEPEPENELSPQRRDESTTLSKPNLSISACKLSAVPPGRPAESGAPPTQESIFKISPVKRAPSLRCLQDFAAKHSGQRFNFKRKDYIDAQSGGGSQCEIVVTADKLGEHRTARRSAERTATGKPVMVRYVEIPFEDMTTADVMEAIIRPVCREQHKSYAEAVIMMDSVSSIGDPTYFVSRLYPTRFLPLYGDCVVCDAIQASHAWDSSFMDLLESVGAFLEGAAKDETFVWLVSVIQHSNWRRYRQLYPIMCYCLYSNAICLYNHMP